MAKVPWREAKHLMDEIERLRAERDEALRDAERLTTERDEARALHKSSVEATEPYVKGLETRVKAIERERDEARAEVERLRARLSRADALAEAVREVEAVLRNGEGLPAGCGDTYAERVGRALVILTAELRAYEEATP